MRVHIFTLRLKENGGGSHQNLLCFIRALKRMGHRVAVHAMFENGNKPPPDVAIQSEKGEGLSFFALQKLAADAMRGVESSADVVLVYGQALMWAAGMYRSSFGRVPVAVYLDSHLDSMKEAYRGVSLLRRLFLRAWEILWGARYIKAIDRFFFVSPYLSEKYARFSIPREKQTVVPNAFDFLGSNPSVPRGTPTILYVGRLSYEKGPDLLVDALSSLSSKEWHARIIGDGPMRKKIEEQIRHYGLEKRIEITGWHDSATLSKEYAIADIFVLPSRVPEPFGRTVVEAMHAGLPVIVPKRGGAAWVAGEGGISFENGDPASLAHAIEKFLDDASLRRQRAEKGKERARDFAVTVVGPVLEAELSNLATAT